MKHTLSLVFTLFIVTAHIHGPSSAAGMDYNQIRDAYHRSYRQEASKNYSRAIREMNGVIRAFPDAYTPNLRLGYLNLLLGNFEQAITHYKAASAALPDALSPKIGLMNVHLALKDYEAVKQLGVDILERDAGNYLASVKKAHALIQLKEYSRAQAILERLLALYPEDVHLLVEYGALFAARNNRERASAIYSDVLILSPGNRQALEFFR